MRLRSRICLMVWETIWVLIQTMHVRRVNRVQTHAPNVIAGITKIVNYSTEMNLKSTVSI